MGNLSHATREIMWNISNGHLIYVLLVLSMSIFGYGVYQRIILWKKGKPDNERFSDFFKRFQFMTMEVIFQNKVRQSRLPAIFHSVIFYSFIILLITTSIVALDYDFGTSLFKGYLYVFFTLASDIAGVLMFAGVLLAAKRRYWDNSKTLETGFADHLALGLLALIIVTGFAAEGLRIAVAGDKWRLLSPIGVFMASFFQGISVQEGASLHEKIWWVHTLLVFGWIATLPYTKFFHLLALPANAFFSKLKPAGELNRVDIEALMESEDFDEENFNIGIGAVKDFTWKQRMDFDACVSCGRCEEVCPAFTADQPLSPKLFIARMRDLTRKTDASAWEAANRSDIVGNAFDQNFQWYCRTCMACTQVCPAFIAHVDTLIDIRRNEVVMKGEIPAEAGRSLKTMQNIGNPFGSQPDRVNWVNTLDVRIVGPDESCDVLYWIGCLITFDPNKNKIATDMIKILKKCSIDFGVLGDAEVCCGDPARVLGDENAFQTTAKQQVEELNQRRFKTILTSCPHCYNVLKNEYPQFGGKYRVIHSSEFLMDLIQKGKLRPEKRITGSVTYHDPCYLGRYQNIFDAPRDLINTVSLNKVTEMKNQREKSLCCGGGGGHFWMDFKEGKRINTLRVKQAHEKGAATIATACPFCYHMLDDAIKILNLDEKMKVIDIGGMLVEK